VKITRRAREVRREALQLLQVVEERGIQEGGIPCVEFLEAKQALESWPISFCQDANRRLRSHPVSRLRHWDLRFAEGDLRLWSTLRDCFARLASLPMSTDRSLPMSTDRSIAGRPGTTASPNTDPDEIQHSTIHDGQHPQHPNPHPRPPDQMQ
jgi:hypothetical protein